MQQILIVILVLLPLPAIFKSMYIDNYILGFSGANGTQSHQVLFHDFPVFAVIYLLFTVGLYRNISTSLRRFLRFLGFFLFVLYLVDMYLMYSFFQHLTVHDTIKYIGYVPQYLMQILDFSLPLLGGVIMGLVLLFVLVFASVDGISGKTVFTTVGLLCVVSIINSLFISDHYVHSWFYKNLYEYNSMIMHESKPYSKAFKRSFEYEDTSMICRQSVSQKPDIIILMMESLSNYQSRLFSGINNWMPVLDSIAEKNMYFTHFVANGFTTEDGEISLLKGQVPITPPNTFTTGGGTAFAGFYGEDNSLPLYLSQNGYSTSFLTSSDLKFSNTGNWAKSLGFEYVEGSKHPYYDQWPRYQFNAAPDDALYQRIIQHLDEKTSKAKRFIFVKTVSTHHPYLDPVSGSHSEEKTFRYADQALGRLYAALEKRDFFRNGLLVIVGDHHSMVPLRSSEIQKFGMLDAQSKIPLIIVGKDKAKPVSERYQQIDIHNSLKSLVLGQSCTSQWIGDVLAKIPPKYIIHRRGDNRAAVNVYSDRLGATEIFLDGDTTYAVGDAPEQQAFVAKINQLRIQ